MRKRKKYKRKVNEMGLGYNPQEAIEGTPVEGEFPFRIIEMKEDTFSTGSNGVKIRFHVKTSDGIVKARLNIVFPSGLWMLKQLCHSVGVSFDPPADAWDFEGKGGHAAWSIEEYKGRRQMVPMEFYARPDAGPIQPPLPRGPVTSPPTQAAQPPQQRQAQAQAPPPDDGMPPWPNDNDGLPF